MKISYSEKLKDPRWQKKRLEILELHEWTCQNCGDTNTELHVHHVFYKKGCPPWDYPNKTLRCLCKNCHIQEQEEFEVFMEKLAGLDGRSFQIVRWLVDWFSEECQAAFNAVYFELKRQRKKAHLAEWMEQQFTETEK